MDAEHPTITALRRGLESMDPAAVEPLLAEDCVFISPAVFRPYEGKLATSVILHSVARVFRDFRYVRSFPEDTGHTGDGTVGHVLMFEATVGEWSVEGIDMIRLDADGLVCEFRVMVRPLSGLQALVEAMGAVLPEVTRELGLA